jgi:hypothetical protein
VADPTAMIPALTLLRIAPRVTPLSEEELVRYLEDAGFMIERTLHLELEAHEPNHRRTRARLTPSKPLF